MRMNFSTACIVSLGALLLCCSFLFSFRQIKEMYNCDQGGYLIQQEILNLVKQFESQKLEKANTSQLAGLLRAMNESYVTKQEFEDQINQVNKKIVENEEGVLKITRDDIAKLIKDEDERMMKKMDEILEKISTTPGKEQLISTREASNQRSEEDFELNQYSLKRAEKLHFRAIVGVFSCIDVTPVRSCRQLRDVIRRTWMAYPEVYHPLLRPEGNILVLFVMGIKDKNVTKDISQESMVFGDMIFLSSTDKINNGKNYHMYEYLLHHFSFDYLVKTDDDSYVFIDNLLARLKQEKSKQLLLMGNGQMTSRKYKNLTLSKVPFIRGGAILFSHDLVMLLVEKVKGIDDLKYTLEHEDMLVGVWISYFNLTSSLNIVFDPKLFNELPDELSWPRFLEQLDETVITHFKPARPLASSLHEGLYAIHPPSDNGEKPNKEHADVLKKAVADLCKAIPEKQVDWRCEGLRWSNN